MNNKILFAFVIIVFVAGIFTVFATIVNAEGLNFLYPAQKLTVTIKNEADIDKSKNKISEIPDIKIIKTIYRDKEWSKMVNKYDLPNMENPFKNEFVLKIGKNADMAEVYNKLKEMSFVEKADYYSDKLALTDKYQIQYFAIIKRNNVLLNFEDNKVLNKDRKELKNLYAEVKRQIKNKNYLKEYKIIEKKYSKCDGVTTAEINDFAIKNYKEADDFLNTVYKKIQAEIPSEDFMKLALSEEKWQQEVKAYEKVYNSMGFGTIGTSIYYGYQTDMINFRTLLLMLYL